MPAPLVMRVEGDGLTLAEHLVHCCLHNHAGRLVLHDGWEFPGCVVQQRPAEETSKNDQLIFFATRLRTFGWELCFPACFVKVKTRGHPGRKNRGLRYRRPVVRGGISMSSSCQSLWGR